MISRFLGYDEIPIDHLSIIEKFGITYLDRRYRYIMPPLFSKVIELRYIIYHHISSYTIMQLTWIEIHPFYVINEFIMMKRIYSHEYHDTCCVRTHWQHIYLGILNSVAKNPIFFSQRYPLFPHKIDCDQSLFFYGTFFTFFSEKSHDARLKVYPFFTPKKTKIALVPKKYCPPSTVQFLASTLLIQLRGSKMELQTTTVAKTEKKERRSIWLSILLKPTRG